MQNHLYRQTVFWLGFNKKKKTKYNMGVSNTYKLTKYIGFEKKY